jgi:2-keto-4-pentenoate hydratase/2-oxohepta-3-ene-1,7-dioic acid hydratase in catechol pathway
MDKIICIGKNYPEHAKELGEIQPDFPVIFLKPPSVLKQASSWETMLNAQFPEDEQVVPECELVLEIGSRHDIRQVSVGLDMTLRIKQKALKQLGHPWTLAKVFPDAAILGPWQTVQDLPNWQSLQFGLRKDGKICQQTNAAQMIFDPIFTIEYIRQFFPLCEGDIIFTGTPMGCINISIDDNVEIFLGEKKYYVRWERALT